MFGSLLDRIYNPPWLCYVGEGDGAGGGDGGGSGGGSGGTETGGTPPAGSGEATGGNEGGKTFTQDQLDAIIKDRLKKHLKPEDLGFESKAELDRFIKAARDREEAEKDEQVKAIEAAKKEGREEATKELTSKANARLVKSEFIVAAKDKGVIAPQDLYLIAKGEGRFDDLEVSDDDEVKGMDDAWWEELLKGRDHLKGTPGQQQQQTSTPGDIGAGTRGPTRVPEDRQEALRKQYPALNRR